MNIGSPRAPGILLIGNFAPDAQESMQRFARMLTEGLRNRGHEVDLWAPERGVVRLLPRYRYGGMAKLFGYFDKFVLFPRRIRRGLRRGESRAEVVHILDQANAVYSSLFAGRPLLATCHDLLQISAALGEIPQHRLSASGRRYQQWILRAIRRLPFAVCVSAHTARELQRLGGFAPDRMAVIPNGLNFPYRPTPREEARQVAARLLTARGLPADTLEAGGRGFILNVGGGQWYKNRLGLVEIYALLRDRLAPPPRLVLMGKPPNDEIAARIRSIGVDADVVRLQNLTESELQAVYSLAEALIFPSWQEGFGWPVAEAQACGCAVFTSDRPPLTEVGGDAAVYFDPGDPPAAAERIAAAWPGRSRLAEKGRIRAAEWDAGRMIDRYAIVYALLAEGKKPQARDLA